MFSGKLSVTPPSNLSAGGVFFSNLLVRAAEEEGKGEEGKGRGEQGGGVACVLCPTKRFDIVSHLLFPHCGQRLPCTLARTWFVVTSVTSGGGMVVVVVVVLVV